MKNKDKKFKKQIKKLNIPHVDMDPDLHSIKLSLSLPPNKRTHFLRLKLPNGGSCL